jgi:hypothetical protein
MANIAIKYPELNRDKTISGISVAQVVPEENALTTPMSKTATTSGA